VDERAAAQGVGSISPELGLQALGRLLEQGAAQVGVVPINWSRFARSTPYFAELAAATVATTPAPESTGSPEPEWARRLAEAPAHKRAQLLLNYVQEQAGRVLGLDPSRLPDQQPLREAGLDSLMAVELRNRLGSGLGLKRKLPATLVFDYPTVAALSDYLAHELMPEGAAAAAPPAPEAKPDGMGTLIDSIEDLSDEEVDRLFAERGLA
jgi:acyl carrier protein